MGSEFDEKMEAKMEVEEEIKIPIFRDIRRYYCEFCGICRSKKTLINSHILTHHKEELEKQELEKRAAKGNESSADEKSNTCEECGATFKKLAHLKQHMQSHSLLRPFICPVDDCNSSYRRKDHLNRHLLQHEGKVFRCPHADCNVELVFQSNMKRHVKEFHSENDTPSTSSEEPKQSVCKEAGCGKVFKYASRLRKHENSHVKLQSVEAFCFEPGCMKTFTNDESLRAHIQTCHLYTTCDICGKKQLKKNMKRHLCKHKANDISERIKCHFEGCHQTFSTKSNLQQHVKVVHIKKKPFACCFTGCGQRFSYKHVRDNHEKSGCHVYTMGDFEELDSQFRMRPRGGRKRTCPTVDMLVRKRVTAPSETSPLRTYDHGLQANNDGDVNLN